MKYFIVPGIILVLGVVVLGVAIRYYIQDSVYAEKTQEDTGYLAPNYTCLLLGGLWIILSIYLFMTIFTQTLTG